MQRTTLGKTGLEVSRLGFGGMRFPMTADGKVDRDQAIPLLHKAVELGINYFDSAIGYCNGDSQRIIGEAMEGMRDKVVLSTKNHMHESPDDVWWARLEESLELLRTDCIDVYNMHGMTWSTWTKHIDVPNGKLRLLQKARDQGMIAHIGCSFHDDAEALINLAETGVVESITLQYNLLNRSLEEAIHRVHECNVGTVVMGPVGGGQLGVDSERIRELTNHEADSTPEAAFRFVLAHPGVNVALSGMSDMDMLLQNVDTVAKKAPFSQSQIARLHAEVERVRERIGVICVACGYCMPCPSGVQIPQNFGILNQGRIYGLIDNAQLAYSGLEGKAVKCAECGACVPKCPQKIDIPAAMRQVVSELDTEFTDFGGMLSLLGVNDGKLEGRITVKSLSDDTITPRATLDLAEGVSCDPPIVEFPDIRPGSSASAPVKISVPDGVGSLHGNIVVTDRDETRISGVHNPFFLIPRDGARWHCAELAPTSFSNREDIIKTHGYRVRLSHDDDKIYVELDIRSQLHGLASAGESSGARMEMYVDMRTDEAGLHRAPYSDGAEQFFLSLGAAGHGTQSQKRYTLDQRNEPTASGVHITLELSFSEFITTGQSVPKEIGLDFMFVVCEDDGRELGYPTYGGKGGLFQNPAGFTIARLV